MRISLFLCILICLGNMTASDIISEIADRETNCDTFAEIRMEMIDNNGKTRTRELRMFRKHADGKTKLLVCFTAPNNVAGTSFLSVSDAGNPEKTSQWLYLPSIKRVQRIPASNKNDSFMGTEFTYGDLGERNLDSETYRFAESDQDEGMIVIDCIPKNSDSGYSLRKLRISRDGHLLSKVLFFDSSGEPFKEMSVKKTQRIDGVPRSTRLEMRNLKTGKRTVLLMKSVAIDPEIPDFMFTERGLKAEFGLSWKPERITSLSD